MASFNEIAEILRLYFIQGKQISLNSLGSFELKQKPAVLMLDAGKFSAPDFFIDYTSSSTMGPSKEVIHYLSKKRNISEGEAMIELNGFINQITKQLEVGENVQWKEMGFFQQLNGHIQFTPISILPNYFTEIDAEFADTIENDFNTLGENSTKKWNIYLILLTILAAIMITISFFAHNGFILYKSGSADTVNPPEQSQTIPAE